jgi:hypothetical protein
VVEAAILDDTPLGKIIFTLIPIAWLLINSTKTQAFAGHGLARFRFRGSRVAFYLFSSGWRCR